MIKQLITNWLFFVGPAVRAKSQFVNDELECLIRVESKTRVVTVENIAELYKLPSVSDEIVYKTMDTGDLYLALDGIFKVYNPYSEQKFRPVLEDHSTILPHTEDPRMGLYYNVCALRIDLNNMRKFGMKMSTMLGKNPIVQQRPKRGLSNEQLGLNPDSPVGTVQVVNGHSLQAAWLLLNHTKLVKQIRAVVEHDGLVNREIESAISKLGISITYDRSNRMVTYRDGDFVAQF